MRVIIFWNFSGFFWEFLGIFWRNCSEYLGKFWGFYGEFSGNSLWLLSEFFVNSFGNLLEFFWNSYGIAYWHKIVNVTWNYANFDWRRDGQQIKPLEVLWRDRAYKMLLIRNLWALYSFRHAYIVWLMCLSFTKKCSCTKSFLNTH